MDLSQVCPVQRSSQEHLIQEVNMSTLQMDIENQVENTQRELDKLTSTLKNDVAHLAMDLQEAEVGQRQLQESLFLDWTCWKFIVRRILDSQWLLSNLELKHVDLPELMVTCELKRAEVLFGGSWRQKDLDMYGWPLNVDLGATSVD